MCVLSEIQTDLKAPKDNTNTFGNYRYRSCEDILESVKPLLEKHHANIVLSDEIVQVGNRYYVKATAALETKEKVWKTCAYAREPETKKGMDESQITGAASSYARKYALNGLLAIDDTKDADTQDNTTKPQQRAKEPEVLDEREHNAKRELWKLAKQYYNGKESDAKELCLKLFAEHKTYQKALAEYTAKQELFTSLKEYFDGDEIKATSSMVGSYAQLKSWVLALKEFKEAHQAATIPY